MIVEHISQLEPRLRFSQDAGGKTCKVGAAAQPGPFARKSGTLWEGTGRLEELKGFRETGPMLVEKAHPKNSPVPFIQIVLWPGPVRGLLLECYRKQVAKMHDKYLKSNSTYVTRDCRVQGVLSELRAVGPQ